MSESVFLSLVARPEVLQHEAYRLFGKFGS